MGSQGVRESWYTGRVIEKESRSVRYFQFHSFDRPELVHAVFSRHGGVSPEPWASLNLGGTVGDERDRVIENRRRAFAAVDRPFESLADLWQVHSRDVIRVDDAAPGRTVQADALITNRPHLSLFLRFADCVPILLHDPKRQAVGLVHSGWKGTALKVAAAAVKAMSREYGSRPSDILAGIGPSIGPDHYEVGPEVVEAIRSAYRNHEGLFFPGNGTGRLHLDLWAANWQALVEAGVEQIEVAGMCTACHSNDFFSHRGEKGRTGRFAALMALRA